VKEGKKLAPFF